MAMATLAVLTASAFVLPTVQIVNAQYVGGGGTTGGNIEEQLKLAREKIQNSKQAGAYGSGTPMLGTNISETVLFIAIIVIIFGSVAAAFFIKGRSAKKEVAR
jgi:hypothetical protein